jgi:hypothetical protein
MRAAEMEQQSIDTGRASSAVFREYVRGVLAEHSQRSRALLARRMRWLRRVRVRQERKLHTF